MRKWMPLLIFLLLLLLPVSSFGEKPDSTAIIEDCPHVWTFQSGSPCKIVIDRLYSGPHKTFYFTRDGKMLAAFAEYLDTPDSHRPIVSSSFYAYDENENLVGLESYYYNLGDRGSIDTVFKRANNYTLSKKEQLRRLEDGVGKTVYQPEDVDSKGNWLISKKLKYNGSLGDEYKRKIYYYGESTKVEKEVKDAFVRRDSLLSYCKANAWSAGEKADANRKDNYGLWWNILVPLLLGVLFGYIPSYMMSTRSKLSNMAIIIISIAIAWFVGGSIAKIVLIIGPYGSIWEMVFWVIAVGSFLACLSITLYKRCPNCASFDCRVIKREIVEEEEKETTKYLDGSKETSRRYHYKTIETIRCEKCGHVWKATRSGIVKD